MAQNKHYEVAIVGGGITGTSILYMLAKYTNVDNMILLERDKKVGNVNSHKNNNSQTLHFGDIETNYTAKKARKVKSAVGMMARYVEDHAQEAYTKYQKMILAVGDREVAELEERYKEFKEIFPNLKRIEREEIARIEPRVVEDRDENTPLLALVSKDGYTVDFGKVSQSMVDNAKKTEKEIEIVLNRSVCYVKKSGKKYKVEMKEGTITADVVVIAAGGMSLTFARELGYARNWILLPVAGSFYYTPKKVLNGKIYTMQDKKLPFAAVHGDPEVYEANHARFGPTAKVLPMLERHRYKTVLDFIRLFELSWNSIMSIYNVLNDWTVLKYVLKNFVYDLPLIGKMAFMRQIRKIVPSLKMSEITFAKGFGGIRPQIVNTDTRKLELGEAEILGENIIFHVTPSPGASVSIKNAKDDAKRIVEMLGKGYSFNEKQVEKDFEWTNKESVT